MTKEQLRAYRALLRERAQLEEDLEELETALLSPRASQLTGMPRGGGDSDPVARLAAKHEELISYYQDKLAWIEEERIRIERAIDSLEPIERMTLRAYYIDGLRWEEVCVRVSYSWRRVHQIHARALKKLSNTDYK